VEIHLLIGSVKCKPRERNLKIVDRALSRSQAQPSILLQRSINECILLLKIRESILYSRMKQNCMEPGVELGFFNMTSMDLVNLQGKYLCSQLIRSRSHASLKSKPSILDLTAKSYVR
jgi:hypothetical protein